MLQDVLEAEVDDFLGRRRYQRTEDKRGNRNGHLPERTIGVGMGAVEVRLPRVSDVPSEVSPDGFVERRSKLPGELNRDRCHPARGTCITSNPVVLRAQLQLQRLVVAHTVYACPQMRRALPG